MASFIAKAPNGKSFRVDVPDGLSPEQVSAEVDKVWTSMWKPEPPAFEKEAAQIASTTPAEAISALPQVRAFTSAVETPLVLAERAITPHIKGPGGIAKQFGQVREMQEKGAKGLGQSSLTGIVSDIAGSLLGPAGVGIGKWLPAAGTAMGRIAQGGAVGAGTALGTPEKPTAGSTAGGAGMGAGAQAAIEAITKSPALARSLGATMEARRGQMGPPAPKPGAEKVVSELQRQRNVAEGVDKSVGSSLGERTRTDFDERMRQMRDVAFREGAPVEVGSVFKTMDAIEATPRGKQKEVADAFRAVRERLKAWTEEKGPAMSKSQRAQWGEFLGKLDQGKATRVSPEVADEMRQAINAVLDTRDQAGKPLYGLAQKELVQVKKALETQLSEPHKAWLAAESKGRGELARFEPGARETLKVTTTTRGAEPLTGESAKGAMAKVFESDKPEVAFKQLVQDTSHDSAAKEGVKNAFEEWMFPAVLGGKVKAEGVGRRWDQVRVAVADSGMYTPEHFAAMDRVIKDIYKKTAAKAEEKTTAGALGMATGATVGRPGSGGLLGRELMDWVRRVNITPEQWQSKIKDAMKDPAKAELLAAPPTDTNIEATVQSVFGQAYQRERQRQKKKDPTLTMQPMGF